MLAEAMTELARLRDIGTVEDSSRPLGLAAPTSSSAATAPLLGGVCAVVGGAATAIVATRKFGETHCRPLVRVIHALGMPDSSLLSAVHVSCEPRWVSLDGPQSLLVRRFEPEAADDPMWGAADTELFDLLAYFASLASMGTVEGARHKRWRQIGSLARVDASEARWMAGMDPKAPTHAQALSHSHSHGHGHGHSHGHCRGESHDGSESDSSTCSDS